MARVSQERETMADIKDISDTISSALTEIGVHGNVDVRLDGNQAHASIGQPSGDDIDVAIVVTTPEPAA
jgi:hypothetical protein